VRVTWPCLDERWRLADVLAPDALDERAVYVRSRHIVHDDTNLLTSRSAREPVPVRPGQPRAKPPRAGRCESERRLHALAPSQFWRMCLCPRSDTDTLCATVFQMHHGVAPSPDTLAWPWNSESLAGKLPSFESYKCPT
jgi:hypothetical protein